MSLPISSMSCRQSTTLGTNRLVELCCAAAAPLSSQRAPHQSTNASLGILVENLLCARDWGSPSAKVANACRLIRRSGSRTGLLRWIGNQLKRLDCRLAAGLAQIRYGGARSATRSSYRLP